MLMLCLLLSKGNRVNIPELGRGYRCYAPNAVTQTNPETLAEALGRVLSSLLGTNSVESLRAEIRMLFP